MNSKPGRGSDQFMLRLPDGMRERIKRAADENGRSMNAEVVATLEEKYPAPPPSEFNGDWQVIYDYLNLVDSAADDAERSEILASVNATMRANPSHAGFEIRVMKDFDGETFSAFIAKAKPKE